MPALQSSRIGLSEKLKEGDRGSTAGHARLRNGLIVSEVAVALVLLIAAGLLIESFAQLARVRPGFNPESLLTFNIALPTILIGTVPKPPRSSNKSLGELKIFPE